MPDLIVEDLSVSFPNKGKTIQAVRGISFEVKEGETVGIVGESGSGKTAAVQGMTQLSHGIISGKISFGDSHDLKPFLGKEIGMVFQDPMTSLNPTMKIGAQIAEGLIYHKMANRKAAWEKAVELLNLVKVPQANLRVHQYPHHLSGGMRQRVLIAIAIATNPRLLIADEPTTALDATVRIEVLALLKELKKHFRMSLLLITHDFGVVASMCEKVLVMYAGKIVERGTTQEVLSHPKHPYTQMLLNSVPRIDRPKGEPLSVIEGTPPHPLKMSEGCAFKERCPFAAPKCNEEPKGTVACWRIL